MKPKDPPVLLRWFAVWTVFTLFVLLTRYFAWFIIPCFLAVVLYYFLSPFVDWLEGRGLSHNQGVCLVFLILGLLALLYLPPLIKPLFEARTSLASDAKTYLEGGKRLMFSLIDWAQEKTGFMEDTSLRENLDNHLTNYLHEDIPQKIPAAALNILSFIPLLLLVPFTAFFLLRDGRDFKKAIVRGIPNAFFERALFLFYRVDRQVTGFLRGVFFEALVVGVLIGSGHYLIEASRIAEPKHYLLIGTLAAVFNLVPYLGPLVVYIIAVIVTYTDTQNPETALWLTVLFIVTKMIDDFLVAPMVLGKSMKIHPVAIVFALFIAGEIAGFVGLVLALPALGITLVVFDVLYLTFHDQRLQLRHRQTKLSLFGIRAADVLKI